MQSSAQDHQTINLPRSWDDDEVGSEWIEKTDQMEWNAGWERCRLYADGMLNQVELKGRRTARRDETRQNQVRLGRYEFTKQQQRIQLKDN